MLDEVGLRLVRSLGQIYVLNVHMGLTAVLTVGHYPDMNIKITTESPRLDATPGEWYASDLHAMTSTGFPWRDATPGERGAIDLVMTKITDVPQMDDGYVFRREVATVQTVPGRGCRTVQGFPQIDSAAVDCGAVELN